LFGNQVLRQDRQAVRKSGGHGGAAKAVQDNRLILSGRPPGFPLGEAGTIQP
jgi:hypothetical protein